MIRRTLLMAGVVAVCLASASGCAPTVYEGDGATGAEASPIIGHNGLTPAALDPTAALTPALLAGAALQYGALDPAAQDAIEDPSASGTTARLLLSYAVGCAFDPTQPPFEFSWTDASGNTNDESYPGSFALATDWEGGPIDPTEQPWISACLIARANYYGIHVSLSCRGAAAGLATTPDELANYPYEEGAFWGDLFSDSPTAYACDYVPDDTHSEEAWRVCATGVDASGNPTPCGIIQPLGSCTTYCVEDPSGQFYSGCSTDPTDATTLTTEPIEVFLQ